MAKKRVKLNQKYLDSLGIDIDMGGIADDACIKRIHYDSDIDVILPLDQEQFAVGNITTIDVDADGDVLLTRGIDVSRYEKNPVVLFNHSLNSPIGYAEALNIQDDKIIGKTRFGQTPEAQKIYQLIKDKVLRTHSVGFIALEGKVRGERGFDELIGMLKIKFPEKFDDTKVGNINRIITKSLLVEYSIVTIPANEEAVISEIKALKEETETKEIDVEPEVEEVVEEIKNMDVTNEEPEEEVVEEKQEKKIKVIKKASKIKVVSTVDKENAKNLKKLYLAMWGI